MGQTQTNDNAQPQPEPQTDRPDIVAGDAKDIEQVLDAAGVDLSPRVPDPAVAGAPIISEGPGQPAARPRTPRAAGGQHPYGGQYLTGGERAPAPAPARGPQAPPAALDAALDPGAGLDHACDRLAERIVRSELNPKALGEGERRTVDRDVHKLQALIAYAILLGSKG